MMKFVRSTMAALLVSALAATIAAAQQPTTVILVRHAEKSAANPSDPDPPLSPAGQQRARELIAALNGRRVDAIITTQLQRTRLTAQPLADSLHLTPEVVQTGAGPAAVAELIRTRHAGHTVLVVGHSNTVTKIIAALGGPALGDICDPVYGNLFTLTVPANGAPQLAHGHYGAADPADGPACVNGMVPAAQPAGR